jgi:hypothetical protein
MSLPVYELKISENINDDTELNAIALVDAPAIQKDFLAFNEQFVTPNKGEHEDEFIPRCVKYMIDEGKDSEQAVAICYQVWQDHFAGGISFDFDGVLSTSKGQELAKEKISNGTDVFIVSARHDVSGMFKVADELGIPHSRIYATGSNTEKVKKIQELGISKHYDNNPDVIKALSNIGEKFNLMFADTYDDYPKEATENAKTALRWAEENGWGSCGEATGKARANQLANREKISRDTIARMSSFARHKQNSQGQLGDGCGRLMWLAWGGDAGIEWAQRKLKQIDSQKMHFEITNEEQKVISGPLLIADKLIYRNNEKMGEHYVVFSADTIKQIAIKYFKKGYQNNVNLQHDPNQKVDGVTMFESWIVDKSRGTKSMVGYEDVADGSWFGSFYVENEDVWNKIKSGEFKGFSVEGLFDYANPLSYEEKILNNIKNLLNSIS